METANHRKFIEALCYEERLRGYEREKQRLIESGISALEYEKRLIELIWKWKI